MNDPIPNKDRPVEVDAQRMMNQVGAALLGRDQYMIWPRKPLSPPTKGNKQTGRSKVRSKTTTKHHTKSKGMKRSHNMDTLSGMWD